MLLQTSDAQIKTENQKGNTATFSFGPLPTGFGHVIGNSLRRVLLTSLEGGAITAVKVPGVNHQFSTIDGVKEDLVELSLNLKGVKVNVHNADGVIGTISAKGPGEVLAKDIEVTSDVEILNPDYVIATLADKKAQLNLELTFERGVGYLLADSNKKNKVGLIPIDALFSPVLTVSYEVEVARKDKKSGLDELLITITSDGSISPEEALTQGCTIIRNFFSRFAQGPDPIVELSEDEESPVAAKEIYLDDVTLPTRTINALKKHGISTLNELATMTDDELADIKNLGEKSLVEIKDLLKEFELK